MTTRTFPLLFTIGLFLAPLGQTTFADTPARSKAGYLKTAKQTRFASVRSRSKFWTRGTQSRSQFATWGPARRSNYLVLPTTRNSRHQSRQLAPARSKFFSRLGTRWSRFRTQVRATVSKYSRRYSNSPGY